VPTLMITSEHLTFVEGQAATDTVATFTDTNPGPVPDYSAVISWGDGSPTTTGTITESGQTFSVTGTHTYTEVTGPSASLPVTVQIQKNRPGNDQFESGTANSTATVLAEGNPLTGTGVAVCAAEGVPLQGVVVATFTDSEPRPLQAYSATINWGDGTAPTAGTVQTAAGIDHFEVLGSHTYAFEGSYSLTITVTAPRANPLARGDGAKPLVNQEGFDSITIHSTAMVGGFISQLYQDVLGRQADAAGLAFWDQQLHSGLSRQAIAAAFWGSAEHRGIEVDQFYQDFLGRAADAAGRAGWVNALLSGVSEGQVAIDFLTSAEYTASHPDTDSYVQGLYQDILNRSASPSELAYWAQIINSGDRSRAAVAFYFLTSEEAYVDAIEGYYRVFLRRSGDAQGVQGWLQLIESGTASPTLVAAGFLGSQEYLDLAQTLACQGQ
jgi:Domain of unknown function (DUF4214)